jgi:hypothetical protein
MEKNHVEKDGTFRRASYGGNQLGGCAGLGPILFLPRIRSRKRSWERSWERSWLRTSRRRKSLRISAVWMVRLQVSSVTLVVLRLWPSA